MLPNGSYGLTDGLFEEPRSELSRFQKWGYPRLGVMLNICPDPWVTRDVESILRLAGWGRGGSQLVTGHLDPGL